MSDNSNVPCAICKGSEREHEGARHVYTTQPGDLRAPEKPKPGNPTNTANAPRSGDAPPLTHVVLNLIDALVANGVITSQQAYSIVTTSRNPPGLTPEQLEELKQKFSGLRSESIATFQDSQVQFQDPQLRFF